jgi:hypothetical protein
MILPGGDKPFVESLAPVQNLCNGGHGKAGLGEV